VFFAAPTCGEANKKRFIDELQNYERHFYLSSEKRFFIYFYIWFWCSERFFALFLGDDG